MSAPAAHSRETQQPLRKTEFSFGRTHFEHVRRPFRLRSETRHERV